MTIAAAQNLIGQTVLGRYRIVRRLARGGMGAVYLGRTEGAAGFSKPVVIKRVLPGLMDDEEVAHMFVREAQILSNLQHPNIVGVLDFGQQPDGAYLMVLEYVHGYQLAQWHEYARLTQRQVPVDFALHIAGRVLDALQYAHTFRRGDGKTLQIIHRDVTPSNVLLTEQGEVKLLDFGIARVSGEETSRASERSQVKGKLPYLPPESFQGVEPSVQSDIYSTGVTLYELLTGSNPFLGKETAEIYAKIFDVVPGSIHATRDDAPEDIDQVLARAMARDPAHRFASAAEFAQALRRMRSPEDDGLVERFSARLRADFEGGLPERLRVEPLLVRERAWRSADITAEPQDLDASLAFDQPNARPSARPEQVTVRADISPDLLAATRSPSRVANEAVTVPPPAAGPKAPLPVPPAIVAPPPAAVVPRVPSVPTEVPTPLPAQVPAAASPVPAAAPEVSIRRIALVASLAALGGAAIALAAWSSMRSTQPEQVVVIRQEANAASVKVPPMAATVEASPEPPDPPPVTNVQPQAPPSATPPAAQPPAAAAVAAVAAAPAAAAKAAAPNPKALSRTFGRRQARVETCFAKHGGDAPGNPQLSIHFWVDESGRVTNSEVDPASLRATNLGRCLQAIAQSTSFGPLQQAVSFHIPITAQAVVE